MPRKSLAQLEIERLLSRQSATIRQAFYAFIQRVKSPATLQQIIQRLNAGDIDGALDIIHEHVVTFADVLPEVFVSAGAAEVKIARHKIGGGSVVSFDPGLKEAAEVMSQSKLNLIREFGQTQRDVVRTVLTRSLKAGDAPREAARKFRDVVGLTEYQEQVVSNYQTLLERGSSSALDRQLRNRRYDRMIERTANEGEVLDAKTIERMTTGYRSSMVAHRAEVIGRTESLRAVNSARHEAWRQMAAAVGMKPSSVIRTWSATMDPRTRDTHAELDGMSVEGFDEPFESSSGELLMYPGDPSADASEVINCRCQLLFERS